MLPVLSDDPTVIAIVDVLRTLQLSLGLTVAAVAWRTLKHIPREATIYRGFKHRVIALVLASVFVCLTAYDRLGQPVQMQFPLGLLFLVYTLLSVHAAVTLPPDRHEGTERLRAWNREDEQK